jgi:alkylated DNA repair dioxygenase AlkB
MINTDRYNLNDQGLIASCLEQVTTQGVCVLPDFLTLEAVEVLREQSDALAPRAFRSASRATPYLGPADESFPVGHPRNTITQSSVEVVAYDQFAHDDGLRALYEWEPLLEFIRECLGLTQLFRYADPFGALNLAVMRDGDSLGWHFDMTDFVVSIAIQSSSIGGHFENAKQIRNAEQPNYETIQKVMNGQSAGSVRTEPMTPGTLMLFNGRWSMHRVTTIEGDVPRYVALLAYDTKPGTDSTDTLKMSRYGRLPTQNNGDL